MRYFGLIWVFVQANFVKKIDPASPARGFFIGSLAVSLLTYPAMFLASFVDRPGVAVMALAPLLMPVSIALFFPGVFPCGARFCIITVRWKISDFG
ncbi:MAG: hypothetical protein KatS3mg004_0963 [Bryobacteraceae bacterium]|nr:MAG: hypothetical protein KatS3mg004_0963 [Bryobacteraceae bacterium]